MHFHFSQYCFFKKIAKCFEKHLATLLDVLFVAPLQLATCFFTVSGRRRFWLLADSRGCSAVRVTLYAPWLDA